MVAGGGGKDLRFSRESMCVCVGRGGLMLKNKLKAKVYIVGPVGWSASVIPFQIISVNQSS